MKIVSANEMINKKEHSKIVLLMIVIFVIRVINVIVTINVFINYS